MSRFWLGFISIGFTVVSVCSGQTWVSNSVSPQQWTAIACSADGTKWNATVYGGPIYSSTNSGATWATNGAPVNNWNSIASSADGRRLAAAIYGGGIYTSTDAGTTWKLSGAPSTSWMQVVSSADGFRLFAAQSSGSFYYSTNAGTNWNTLATPPKAWSTIACSANGIILLAVASQDSSPVYVSTNAGSNWTTNSITSQPGAGTAASADGSKLFIATVGFNYESTNYGVTWTRKANTDNGCSRVACSADGHELFSVERAALSSNYIAYVSADAGATWASQTITNTYNNSLAHVMAVAMSADGGKLMFGNGESGSVYIANSGHSAPIYSLTSVVSPTLNELGSSNKLSLAWIVPSTNFTLTTSTDLFAWGVVTNAVTLNLTNLQYQATLPATNEAGFFRLATP